MPIPQESECWKWPYGKTNRGYGSFRVGHKMVYAHRASYELHFGPIPDGMLILHKCDNPSCFNPDHLYVGDKSDNLTDYYNRHGRSW